MTPDKWQHYHCCAHLLSSSPLPHLHQQGQKPSVQRGRESEDDNSQCGKSEVWGFLQRISAGGHVLSEYEIAYMQVCDKICGVLENVSVQMIPACIST